MGDRGQSHRLAMKVGLQNSASGGVLRPFLLGMVLFIFSSAPACVAGPQKLQTTPATKGSPISSGPEAAPLPPQTEQAIPLPQIADKANELHNRLVEIYQELLSAKDALPSERSTQVRAEEIRERKLFADALIKGIPTSLDLRDEDQYWVSLNRQFTSELKFLTSRAISLQDQIQFLGVQQSVWQATLDQIHQMRAIQGVVDRVQQELNAIKATQTKVQEQLNLVLTLQNQISQQDQQITEVLTQLSQAREQLRGHLFQRDGHPLWESRELRNLDRPMTLSARGTVDRELKSSGDFLGLNKLRALFALALYGLSLFAAFKLKNFVSTRGGAELSPEQRQIFSHPYSVALVMVLVGTIGRFQSATSAVAIFFAVLWLIPILRLLPPLIQPGPRSLLYAFLPSLFLEGARILIPFSPALKREAFLLNMLLALSLLVWMIRPARLRQVGMEDRNSRLLTHGVHAGIALLVASLSSNVLGFLSLSQVLGMSALLGFFSAAALFCAFLILTLILTILLQTDWARSLPQARATVFERWTGRVLACVGILAWLNGMSHFLTIHDKIVSLISDALQHPFGYGELRFTIGGSLSVLLVMVLGYALARAFSFVLKKFLLPRMPLQRGVAYAISSVTYYVLLLMVAVVTLAETGVELNKFTVLTGAIGVGLGFGLQSVVNNFVSGLILLFERPIHLGDTVEIGGLIGTVRRIGARSSTILTFQGAEVIVPNSNLLSNQVINWTLSSQWRRVDVPVRVAYGTDPEQVLKLLVDAAESNPRVLRERPPTAYFLGFGDSGMNFELRFWSAYQDTWLQLQSDVVIAVAKTLLTAGIEIPFPQQDLHVRSVDASVRATLAGDSISGPSLAYTTRSVHAEAASPQTHRDPRQK
ncbi:MAG TPA: mechanosensitive ion channel domain-containing protein [Candidatus Limnocylindrales bacterium]|nr:mechanosensitive ion channel domain-containing protein [Candidatus Limnocylindrales bacterium]